MHTFRSSDSFPDSGIDPHRRRFLALASASAMGAALPAATHATAAPKTSARIVIAGAGAAGLATASRLAARLDGAHITLIDPRRQHFYQPGYTLIAAGVKPQHYVVSETAKYIPPGVDWIQEGVAEIDPDGNKVVTTGGKSLPYDYLVVATGLSLHYDEIQGMDPGLIGKDGIASIYAGHEAAHASAQALQAFVERGGRGLFTRPDTEMKCAGAPLKFTFISEDIATRKGRRDKIAIEYFSNNDVLFSVPIVSEKIRMLFRERDIPVNYHRVLTAIDPGRRIATFRGPDGNEEQPYDFIHVIPPMRAPAAVRNSPLPWQSGPWASQGWMEVDRHTLRHVRYHNVFGVGDIAGVPKGKTAASVKWQAPVAVDHLVADIAGERSTQRYDGYTSCPMITRLGRAMLIEFDYENNLVQSFPGVIAPLEELWVSWVMKTMALKPTYISMLRGRA